MANERKTNSFQQLMEEEYESRFTLPQMLAVEQKIQRKQHHVRVASDMLDLFFPKIIKTVINMLGGEDEDMGRKAPSNFKTHRPEEPKAPGGR